MQLSEREIAALNDIRLHTPEFISLLTRLRAEVHESIEGLAGGPAECVSAKAGEAKAFSLLIREIEQSGAAAERLAEARKAR
jgi:hypothetical protein